MQARRLPKQLLIGVATAALALSPLELAWRGSGVDLIPSKALAKDGGGNGNGGGKGGGNGNGEENGNGNR
jgi:hypothetical protein